MYNFLSFYSIWVKISIRNKGIQLNNHILRSVGEVRRQHQEYGNKLEEIANKYLIYEQIRIRKLKKIFCATTQQRRRMSKLKISVRPPVRLFIKPVNRNAVASNLFIVCENLKIFRVKSQLSDSALLTLSTLSGKKSMAALLTVTTVRLSTEAPIVP